MFTLIIPTYNERDNIADMLLLVHQVLETAGITHEIIVVDDLSPDGTGDVVEHMIPLHPWLRIIHRKGPRGLAGAVVDGLRSAQGSILGVMDADGSHDPHILPAMILAAHEHDIVLGSRWILGGGVREWPWFRQVISRTAAFLTRISFQMPLSDPMSGYFVIPKKIFQQCEPHLRTQGFKILLDLYLCAVSEAANGPLKVKEIPYWFSDRTRGQSKLNVSVIVDFLGMLKRHRKHR